MQEAFLREEAQLLETKGKPYLPGRLPVLRPEGLPDLSEWKQP